MNSLLTIMIYAVSSLSSLVIHFTSLTVLSGCLFYLMLIVGLFTSMIDLNLSSEFSGS